VVIGTGGYVCFPVIYAAHRFGARCYLHEQNAFPGVANKSLERYVNKVFLGFPEASEHFRCPEKHVNSGNPVRRDFYGVDKAEARARMGIDQDDFVIFSFGGSQGAQTINDVVFELMREVNGTEGITLLFGTGGYYYEEILARCEAEGIQPADNVRIKLYIDDMPDHLAASDLIISRAGALSVAEICVSGRAAVMVPSPNVTGNHQYFNARSVADKGGAILIEEKDFTSERLNRQVAVLKDSPEKLRAMEAASRQCVPDDATEIIYREIRSDMQGKNE
jgi:UDP-N-acetylglucosamine--N-acetylmuramyl-(pentapeptide) pyrophosphoryl-undecaprenol N-acetylglucosamine transferase